MSRVSFPEMVSVLRERFAGDQRVEVVDKAVSAEAGTTRFFVNEAHATNSLLPGVEDGQRFYAEATRTHDEIEVETTESDLVITIDSGGSPFWGLREIRHPLYRLWGDLPSLTFASAAKSPPGDAEAEGQSVVLTPVDFERRRTGMGFDAHLEVGLVSDCVEVGSVTLFSKDGEVNTHRLRYRIDRSAFSELGDEVWLISGQPVTKRIRIDREK